MIDSEDLVIAAVLFLERFDEATDEIADLFVPLGAVVVTAGHLRQPVLPVTGQVRLGELAQIEVAYQADEGAAQWGR